MSNAFAGEPPDAVILFASAIYDYPVLIKELMAECSPKLLVGCSSAGEFTGGTPSGASACAVAIRSGELAFAVGLGRGITKDRLAAVKEMVKTFRGTSDSTYRYRSALLLTDALAGYTEEFLEHLTVATAGRYQVFGGGAGDAQSSQKPMYFAVERQLPTPPSHSKFYQTRPWASELVMAGNPPPSRCSLPRQTAHA
jgi:hypothetical protein